MIDTERQRYAPNLPVPEAQRLFRFRDAFALWFSLGIGLLVLQAGALLTPGLSLPVATLAILLGSVIGVALLAAAGVIGSDTGLAAMSSLKPVLGLRGAALPATLNAIQLLGWGAFEVIVMRDSADALLRRSFDISSPALLTLAFGVLITALAISGPLSFVRRFLRSWGMWLLLAAALWLTWNLLAHHDVAALWRRPAAGGFAFGAGVDLVLAMPLSWLPLIADYSRFARVPRESFAGTFLGYGIANVWFYVLGAAYGLAAGGGEAVLTTSLAAAGGGLALLLILVDETDNAFADVHSAAVSSATLFTRVGVARLAMGFGAASTLIALLIPMARYENFLLLIGSVFAPLFGVVLSDHFIVRRRRPDAVREARALAWRWRALLAWAAGIALYQIIAARLPNLGATLPALVGAGVLYLLLELPRRRHLRPTASR